jgi:hypothetical protein
MPNEFIIREVEPGYFVKRKRGNPPIRLNDFESAQLVKENLLKRYGEVDSGSLQVTLAIFAISALFVNRQTDLLIRVLSSIVFFFSVFATALLTWAFILTKIPFTHLYFHHSRFGKMKKFPLLFWLPIYYPQVLFKSIFAPASTSFEEQTTELGYLTLLALIALLIGVTVIITIQAFS